MAGSYSLTGRGLTPVSGGVDPLVVTVTGGDSSQLNLATVACEVTATGGSGSYTYQWTLTDPTNTDRTVLLDDDTIDSPTFTPDQTGGGGHWVARCAVTSGSQTITVTKIVTVGQKTGDGSVWYRAARIVSDGSTDASVSGGNIVWGGVTFAAPNTGVSVVDGDLVLANAAGSTTFATSTRTAPLVTVALDTIAGLTALDNRQVLILLDVESYAPSSATEAMRVGLENAANPIGTGSASRGVIGGHAVSTTIRAGAVLYHDESGINTSISTATIATVAGVACLMSGLSVSVYSRTTVYTDAEDALSDTVRINGGMRPGTITSTLNQLIISAVKPSAGAGATCTIQGVEVWVR